MRTFIASRFLKLVLGPAIQELSPSTVLKIRRKYFAKRVEGLSVTSDLQKWGFRKISDIIHLSAEEVKSVREFFQTSQAYNSHVPIKSNLATQAVHNDGENKDSYNSFSPAVSLNCDVIKKLAASDQILAIARDYLGFEPELYSVNTMWTQPSGKTNPVTEMHRDYDDFIFVTFFVYWTSVSRNNGATRYLSESHLNDTPGELAYLEGEAGSVFVLDPYGLHAGNKEVQTDRLVTWMRFGRKPNFTYIIDKNFYAL